MFVVAIVMVARVATHNSQDEADSGMVELSKEADQLFSAIKVVTIAPYSWFLLVEIFTF